MKIRAMIIDDVEETRQSLSDTLESSPMVEVVCKLESPEGVDEMLKYISPDVVLANVDVCLDKRDGIALFDSILKKKVPLIVTGNGKETLCEECIHLLERGAVDFLRLPGEKKNVISKVKNAAAASPIHLKDRLSVIRVKFPQAKGIKSVVAIASSTGGPQALRQILPKLPRNFPAPIIVVQHMSDGFTESLARRLDKLSEIRVKVAKDNERLKKGVAYIAPHGYHLRLDDSRFVLKEGGHINGVIPSADYTMKSIADSFGPDVIGVVLTGMGKDGAKGISEIKKRKGRVIAQDKATSVIYGMPHAALLTGSVDKVVELESIPDAIIKEVGG